MTKLLEQAIEVARQLTPAEQDELARTILRLAGSDRRTPHPLSAGDRAAIEEGIAELDRGEFVSEEEMEALWAEYRG